MSTQLNCPLCRKNSLLKEDIIAQTATAYLIPAHSSPGNYLIVPEQHTEQLTDLPDLWWRDVKQLLKHIPDLQKDYNLSVNFGKNAGQTVGHLHFWVIPRSHDGAASGKGFAKLISEVNEGNLS